MEQRALGMGARLIEAAADPSSGLYVDYTSSAPAVLAKTPDQTSGVFQDPNSLHLIYDKLCSESPGTIAIDGLAAVLHFPRHRAR